jgi:uncharacterized protein YlxW (UPF0749 family)
MDRGASRAALPLAAAVLGFLAVLAAAQPRSVPGRETGRLEVVDLIVAQDERVRELQAEVRELERQVSETGVPENGQAEAQDLWRRAEELAVLAGGAAVTGPGVKVVLDDSSAGRSPTGNPDDLVVHEQDIQTVVNSLWSAGAEAVAINGQRLSSASAVRCAGNTLLLHGSLQTPPYEIEAIGDAETLQATLAEQPGMDRLLAHANAFGLGFTVQTGTVHIGGDTPTPALVRAEPV